MKLYHITLILTTVLIPLFSSCNDFLEEKVYTEYSPKALLSTQEGIDALLAGAYSRSRIVQYDSRNYTYLFNEFPTDIAFESGGGLERNAAPFINFTWSIDDQLLNSFWEKMYTAISSANSVINVVENIPNMSEQKINSALGEARFIRASSYYFLYNLFGTVPIIEISKDATPDEIEEIGSSTPRATKEQMIKYMVDDLVFASENLPEKEDPIGKATKGAALAVLTKLYMHERDWNNVAQTAKEIIDLNVYTLYGDYVKMFSIEGEDNKEFIYRAPCIAQPGYANNYMAHAFPPNYPIQSNWLNFGAQFRTYTAFYDTFAENDIRRKCFVTHYVDQSGTEVELLRSNEVALNNVRSFKYVPDPNAVGEKMGNDIVYVRYADILLCRAEALNELNGPNIESVQLINQIRNRAGIEAINLSDYPTKESLRDFILEERGREFFSEGLRREDLIRHHKFISNAIARGKKAQDYQELYPIPLRQLEANHNLKQNPGYSN
ncbi:MAG: RagB/SusD family nutrient uptake outer membrane protein [Phocaeicola sp.]|uniref:RagB/SusD family nutrient uptake outer membrane protein n=1 Tax=Phocaeicola sp. TaxID=2773926 RepID=UPI003F9F53BC